MYLRIYVCMHEAIRRPCACSSQTHMHTLEGVGHMYVKRSTLEAHQSKTKQLHGAMQGYASPLHNPKIIPLILSLTPTKAVSTNHVHWGVQLGMKAPDVGPVLNHVRGRRVNKLNKEGGYNGWVDRKAGNGCAIQSNVLATAITHAHSTSGRRCARTVEYIRRLTLFNSLKYKLH
jgi:hypothetical protein